MTQKTINGFTASQHLMKEILFRSEAITAKLTPENIEEIYESCDDSGLVDDVRYDIRSGDYETGLRCESSRHYETDAVAIKTEDGIYIGWTYWHGGGKHGEPEAEPWVENAYFVDCVEQEVLAIERTFSRPE